MTLLILPSEIFRTPAKGGDPTAIIRRCMKITPRYRRAPPEHGTAVTVNEGYG